MQYQHRGSPEPHLYQERRPVGSNQTDRPAMVGRVLIKPDGLARKVSPDESMSAVGAWNLLIDHLSDRKRGRAARIDTTVIDSLPKIIEWRHGYRRGYDLAIWKQQAEAANSCPPVLGETDVRSLHSHIFASLGLDLTDCREGRMTRQGIAAIYSSSVWFKENPESLTHYLQQSPVVLEAWSGESIEIGLLVKFVLRHTLGTEGPNSLIHCDVIGAAEHASVAEVLFERVPRGAS